MHTKKCLIFFKTSVICACKKASDAATGQGAYISKIYCYAKVTLENLKVSGSFLAPYQCVFAWFFVHTN